MCKHDQLFSKMDSLDMSRLFFFIIKYVCMHICTVYVRMYELN